jgi:hypothetical protein
MGLGARWTVTSLVGALVFTVGQLLPAAAAAQAADPNAPAAAPPGYPPPQQQPGYPPPQQQPGYPPPQQPQAYPPPQQQGYPPPQGYAQPPGYPPQPYPAQPYAAPQRNDQEYGRVQRYQRPPRRSKGLLIAGPIVLGASYLFTAYVGLLMLSGDYEMDPGTYCVNCDTVGSRLLIPILGPWIAMPEADGQDGKTVVALMGLAQAAGLIMTIAGIARYSATNPDRATAANRNRLQFAFVPTRDGGGLGMVGGSF